MHKGGCLSRTLPVCIYLLYSSHKKWATGSSVTHLHLHILDTTHFHWFLQVSVRSVKLLRVDCSWLTPAWPRHNFLVCRRATLLRDGRQIRARKRKTNQTCRYHSQPETENDFQTGGYGACTRCSPINEWQRKRNWDSGCSQTADRLLTSSCLQKRTQARMGRPKHGMCYRSQQQEHRCMIQLWEEKDTHMKHPSPHAQCS